jgi:hypothetical protein
MQIHLPIAALQVQSGEPFGSIQRVQSVVSPGQWEAVFLPDIVQFPIAHAEAQVLVLPDEIDGG